MKRAKLMSKSIPERVVTYTIWALLFLYSLTILALYIWVFINSFRIRMDFNAEPFGFPKSFTFNNYIDAISNFKVQIFRDGKLVSVYLEELLLNSFLYILGCALAATIAPAIVAYATSRFNFRFNVVLDGIVIVTMILPIVGALPSSLRIMEGLNLRNNFLGVWLMLASGFGFNFLIIYSTFNSLSWSSGEAALIDGASDFKVYWKIMMPLIYPTLSGLFVLAFVSNWNDYMTPLVYLAQKPTMAYGVFQFQFLASSLGYTTPHVLAGFIISMIPILILFFIFQDKIMNNVTAGGLKG